MNRAGLGVLLVVAVLCSGCAAALPALGVVIDAAGFGVGTYQRQKAREAQAEQTQEIRLLREEIARLRQQLAPAPIEDPEPK